MTWMTAASSPNDVQVLNELLTRLQLPHVPTVDAPPMSDAAVAWQALQNTWRQLLSKGWYCCNRRDRVTPATNNTLYFVNNAVRIQTSECLPGDPPWERVVGRPGSSMGLGRSDMVLVRAGFTPAGNGFVPLPGEHLPLVDVMYFVPIGDAPSELATLAVEMTAAVIAGSYGVAVPQGAAMLAMQAVNRLEAEARPSDNTSYDSAETARTWMR